MEPNTSLYAIPGESFSTYQARVGRTPSLTEIPKPSPTFDAERMGSVTPFGIPQSKPETASAGLSEFIGSTVLAPYQAQREQEMQALQGEVRQGQSSVRRLFERLGRRGERSEELAAAQGIDQKKQALDSITSQIEAERLSSMRRVEELQKNPQGLFGSALQDEVARITRESAKTQADLAIVQSAANRSYDTASAIVERQLEAEFEPLKTELEYLKFFYNENRDLLSKKEQQKYQEMLTQEERAYDDKLAEKKNLSSLKLRLLESAAEAGAPVSVLKAIQSSATMEGAYGAAGSYAQKPTGSSAEDVLRSFEKDVKDVDVLKGAGTRENFASILIGKYPQLDEKSIYEEVLTRYGDNWERRFKVPTEDGE